MRDITPPDSDATAHAIHDWNRIAATYSLQAGTPNDTIYQLFQSVLWECLGPLANTTVLDVGCGSGWFCNHRSQAGAQVLGGDGSAALLQRARDSYPTLQFLEYKLGYGLPPFDIQFDRVLAPMVLMDIPDSRPVIAGIRQCIQPQGKLLFTLPHPCFFQAPIVRDAASDRLYRKVSGSLQPEVGRIMSFGGHNPYHRRLSQYMEQLRAQAVAVTRFYAPAHITPKAVDAQDAPFYASIPVFLFVEAMPLPFA